MSNKNNVFNNNSNPEEQLKKSQEKLAKQEKKLKSRFRNTVYSFFMLLIVVGLCYFIMPHHNDETDIVPVRHSYAAIPAESASGGTVVLADGKKIALLDEGWEAVQPSLDGSIFVIKTLSGALYAANETSCELICPSPVASAALSSGGSAVAYTKAGEARIFVYDTAAKTTSSMDCLAVPEAFAVSPDGKSFAYGAEGVAYIIRDGETVTVDGEGALLTPLSVSDGGKFVYALSSGGDIYGIVYGNSVICRLENVDASWPFVISSDSRELLCQSGGSAYSIADCSKAIPICGSGVSFPIELKKHGIPRFDGKAIIYPAATLLDTVYVNQHGGKNSLFGVNKLASFEVYCTDSDSDFFVRSNGGSAYFVADGKLQLYQNSNRRGKYNELDSGVNPQLICISGDKERIFYVTEEGELRTLKGKKSPDTLASGVRALAPFDEKSLYYLAGETLFFYDGSSSKAVSEGISSFELADKMIVCRGVPGGAALLAGTPGGEISAIE